MKKFFMLVISLVMCLTLTGCGNIFNNFINEASEEIEDAKEKVNDDSKETYDDIKLYSDDTKIVFNMNDVYYLVYYHDGVNITGLDYVYNYDDVDTAKFTESMLKITYKDNENVKKVERKGKQIIITFNEAGYYGETVESIKTQYSMLEEVLNN